MKSEIETWSLTMIPISEFEDFLKQCNLLAFKDRLINEGNERVEDVEDLTDGTMK